MAVVWSDGAAIWFADATPARSGRRSARPVALDTTDARAAPPDGLGWLPNLFEEHGSGLVRMARLFVDDRNAAEDLVQEAFIRLARSAGRIRDPDRVAAYLRSIVLNLCRDHNRRGLMSMRHQMSSAPPHAWTDDRLDIRDEEREVLDAVRRLPHRQRDAIVLRYYLDLGIAEIASTLDISPNSVKTHLQRGLTALEADLGRSRTARDAS